MADTETPRRKLGEYHDDLNEALWRELKGAPDGLKPAQMCQAVADAILDRYDIPPATQRFLMRQTLLDLVAELLTPDDEDDDEAA
jgi:hypothetical protein